VQVPPPGIWPLAGQQKPLVHWSFVEHGTHLCIVVSHVSCCTWSQSAFETHSTQAPGVVLHTGVDEKRVQSLLLMHAPHVLFASHTGAVGDVQSVELTRH
jgi:hypothetical protein